MTGHTELIVFTTLRVRSKLGHFLPNASAVACDCALHTAHCTPHQEEEQLKATLEKFGGDMKLFTDVQASFDWDRIILAEGLLMALFTSSLTDKVRVRAAIINACKRLGTRKDELIKKMPSPLQVRIQSGMKMK